MRLFATIAVVQLALAGCTSLYHIDPVTEGYTAGHSKGVNLRLADLNPIDNLPGITPFHLGRDCLPGLGGSYDRSNGSKLVCQQSAVEAVMLIADGAAGNLDSVRLFDKSASDGKTNLDFQSRIARNRLQDYLMASSTEVCDIYKARLYAYITQTNAILDFATLGLSSAATIVTGAEATRLLAGLATAFGGTRATINENYVQGQLASALVSAIDTTRKDLRTNLNVPRETSLDAYSVDEAILDAAKYHELCSVYAALTSLNDKAGDPVETLEKQLERARKLLAFKQEVEDKDQETANAAEEQAEALVKSSAKAPSAQ